MLGMPLTLVAAQLASLGACLKERSAQRRIERALAGQKVPSRGANIGAVQIEANATDQWLNLLLAKAGVGAGGAGLGAVEARMNTPD